MTDKTKPIDEALAAAVPQPPRRVLQVDWTCSECGGVEPGGLAGPACLHRCPEGPAVPQGDPAHPLEDFDGMPHQRLLDRADHLAGEPTPAPQREPVDKTAIRNKACIDVAMDLKDWADRSLPSNETSARMREWADRLISRATVKGNPTATLYKAEPGKTGEAPPSGEPVVVPRQMETDVRRIAAWTDEQVDSPAETDYGRGYAGGQRALARALLAVQPAPASPPRDEPWDGATIRTVASHWRAEAHREKPVELRDFAVLCDVIASVLPAPTVSREVDEVADDRYRLAIDLPDDVYPPERWIREINKTCADLGLAECRIVAVEVDEAAVRAVRQCLALRKSGHYTDAMCIDTIALAVFDDERPAASEKDGAT